MLAAILSPNTDMTGAVGPMKWMPRADSAAGSRGFSEACPHPGQTASTRCSAATPAIQTPANARRRTQGRRPAQASDPAAAAITRPSAMHVNESVTERRLQA